MIHFIDIYMFTVESKSAVPSAIADTSNCLKLSNVSLTYL